MKILQVISYLYPAVAYGGPGKLVYDISQALTVRNHQISIFATDAFNKQRRRNNTDNISLNSEIEYRFFNNINNGLAYNYKAFVALGGINAILNEAKKFDLVHVHEFFTPMTFAASRAKSKFSVPLVLSAHGTLSPFHLSNKNISKKIFMGIFGNNIIKNTSAFIAATDEEIENYRNLGADKDKIHLVKNGINTAEFNLIPAKGKIRKKYKIQNAEIILLYIGRIHKLKGLSELIGAISLFKNDPPVKLII